MSSNKTVVAAVIVIALVAILVGVDTVIGFVLGQNVNFVHVLYNEPDPGNVNINQYMLPAHELLVIDTEDGGKAFVGAGSISVYKVEGKLKSGCYLLTRSQDPSLPGSATWVYTHCER